MEFLDVFLVILFLIVYFLPPLRSGVGLVSVFFDGGVDVDVGGGGCSASDEYGDPNCASDDSGDPNCASDDSGDPNKFCPDVGPCIGLCGGFCDGD